MAPLTLDYLNTKIIYVSAYFSMILSSLDGIMMFNKRGKSKLVLDTGS